MSRNYNNALVLIRVAGVACIALGLMGLAYETVSYYGYQGFFDEATEVMKAAESRGPPPFENPAEFRRWNRVGSGGGG